MWEYEVEAAGCGGWIFGMSLLDVIGLPKSLGSNVWLSTRLDSFNQ
jgi:hypothetical protein